MTPWQKRIKQAQAKAKQLRGAGPSVTKRQLQDEQMRLMGIDPELVPSNISARSHWNRIDQWDPNAVARWASRWNIDPVSSFVKGNAVNQPNKN
jgi:hypothetical protein